MGGREAVRPWGQSANFFSAAERSVYRGSGVSRENKVTFFTFLFGGMKRKPLYLSQQTTKQKLLL